MPVALIRRGGLLVVAGPWPSILSTIWGNDARYAETDFGRFGNTVYVAGQRVTQDTSTLENPAILEQLHG